MSIFSFHHFHTIDSTNEEAKRQLNQGLIQDPTVIWATEQTAGRGTQGRPWLSPPGAGLYFSIIHPFIDTMEAYETIPSQIAATPLFTIAAGLACTQVLRELTQVPVQLKPINDLYIGNHKLGGILTESIIRNGQCQALITGIGINILAHQSIETACNTEQRGNIPTSLQAHIPPLQFSQWSPAQITHEILQGITHRLDHHYQRLNSGQQTEILTEYLDYKITDIDMPAHLQSFYT